MGGSYKILQDSHAQVFLLESKESCKRLCKKNILK